jgi:hypothetical protein
MTRYTRVIIQPYEPMSDDAISLALKVSAQTPWYRGLVQMIEGFRNEFAASSAQRAGDNNALAMARDIGAYEALTGLLLKLEERRAGE